eukprot:g2415.t1
MLICAILSPAENAPRQLEQAHDDLAATEAAESATNRAGAACVASAVEQRQAKCMSARVALEGWLDSVDHAAQAATREAKEAAVAHSTAQKELISFCEKSNIPVAGMFLTAVREMSLYDKLIYAVSACIAEMEAAQHESDSSMSRKLLVVEQKGTSSPLSVQAEADAWACRERDAEEARQEFKMATTKLIQRRQARLDLLRRLHDHASATAGRTLGRAVAVTGRCKAMMAALKDVLPKLGESGSEPSVQPEITASMLESAVDRCDSFVRNALAAICNACQDVDIRNRFGPESLSAVVLGIQQEIDGAGHMNTTSGIAMLRDVAGMAVKVARKKTDVEQLTKQKAADADQTAAFATAAAWRAKEKAKMEERMARPTALKELLLVNLPNDALALQVCDKDLSLRSKLPPISPVPQSVIGTNLTSGHSVAKRETVSAIVVSICQILAHNRALRGLTLEAAGLCAASALQLAVALGMRSDEPADIAEHSSEQQVICQASKDSLAEGQMCALIYEPKRCPVPTLLTVLSLEGNAIGSNGAAALAAALMNAEALSLTKLNLARNAIGDGAMTALAAALASQRAGTHLRELSLASNNLSWYGISELAPALMLGVALPQGCTWGHQELGVECPSCPTCLAQRVAKRLIQYDPSCREPMSNCGLTSLSLRNNVLVDDRGAAALIQVLPKNNLLTQLDMSGCSLTDASAHNFARLLRTRCGRGAPCCALSSLWLHDCKVGDSGAADLGESLLDATRPCGTGLNDMIDDVPLDVQLSGNPVTASYRQTLPEVMHDEQARFALFPHEQSSSMLRPWGGRTGACFPLAPPHCPTYIARPPKLPPLGEALPMTLPTHAIGKDELAQRFRVPPSNTIWLNPVDGR